MERNEYRKQAEGIPTIALDDSVQATIENKIKNNLLEIFIFQIHIDQVRAKQDLPYPLSHYSYYAEFRPINIYIFCTQESISQAIGVFGGTQGRTNDTIMEELGRRYPNKIHKQEMNISQIEKNNK